MGYIHENDDDEIWGRGLDDTLEIQKRMNAINEIMMRYAHMAFAHEDDDEVLNAEYISDE